MEIFLYIFGCFFCCYEIWDLEFIELFSDCLIFFVNFVCESGEAQQVEWSKIQTPTDEVVVPYDTLESTPEGNW